MTKRNVIVIGTSAGGMDALCELNKHLPKDLNASFFVVMHVGNETFLPQILSRCGTLPAVKAEDGKRYEHGCIYCAPPHCHLSITDHKMVLTRGPRENGHRPAADVLFRSAARQHRSKVVGVVLSGGRDDGSAGLYAIKARGGVAIVQDPSEAVTPNMPQNALDMVDVDFCLPVRQIADVLVQLALERPPWTAIRKLKERVVLHKELVERKKRNKGETKLMQRLEESVVIAESDIKLLREIPERI